MPRKAKKAKHIKPWRGGSATSTTAPRAITMFMGSLMSIRTKKPAAFCSTRLTIVYLEENVVDAL